MPAQSWTLCHCVLRHQTPILNAQTGAFENCLPLRPKDHRSDWAAFLGEAFRPCISSLLVTFSLPLQMLIRSHVLADTPLKSPIPEESCHYHADAGGLSSGPHI